MPDFLADAGVPIELVRIIQRLSGDPLLTLDWQIQSVHDFRRSNKSDVEHLKFARSNGWILLTMDLLRGETGKLIGHELRSQGGQILIVSGGPEQDVYRALAKRLYLREEWSELFEAGIAVIQLGDRGRIKKYAADEFRPDTASRSRQQLNQPAPIQRRATRRTRRDASPDQLKLTEEDTVGNPG